MNFDMNVFMNALQAGFGTTNNTKTQVTKTQQEENLFEDAKPAAKNQTQQPQVAQTQQSMGFFAMMGMMFLGMMSFFGFGNNANNNVNNNTNSGNNAAAQTLSVSANQPEKKDIDELQDMFHEAMEPQPEKKGAEELHDMFHEAMYGEKPKKGKDVGVVNAQVRDAAYQKNIDWFAPKESKAVRYLTLEELESGVSVTKSADYDPNNYKGTGMGKYVEDSYIAYEPGKVYYEGADGKIHSEWADQIAKSLQEKIEETGKALNTYQTQHPKANYDNDPEFKALCDAWDKAITAQHEYTVTNYGTF